MWIVVKNGKFGAVSDDDWKETVPCVYESKSLWDEKDGVVCAKVKLGGKSYYINKNGKRL